MEGFKVEELLKQILEQNKTIASNVEKMAGSITRLNEGQEKMAGDITRLNEGQEKMAGDITRLNEGQEKMAGDITRLNEGQEKMAGDITRLNEGQERFEKVQKTMAKDIKAIRDYQHKGLDVDVEKLKCRVNLLEENQKIS
jgi:uncharacterized phage infection (PIP) family protein YhgE